MIKTIKPLSGQQGTSDLEDSGPRSRPPLVMFSDPLSLSHASVTSNNLSLHRPHDTASPLSVSPDFLPNINICVPARPVPS